MWHIDEAKRILSRCADKTQIILQTGFGATGTPHIGTFGEIARTLMVKHALSELTNIPIKVITFSDDLDTLRKVPTNIPNRESLYAHLNKPVTMVPFGEYKSFGHYNNMKMKEFINKFNFDVDFISSYDSYHSGIFNDLLLLILKRKDEIMDIMLPSLRETRQKTYSPFIPIINEISFTEGVIGYTDDSVIVNHNGSEVKVPVINGNCKLQWKVDWAMRWCAFGVDYEISGIDLTDSFKLASKICKALGYKPPEHMHIEMFVDENRQRISKSKGNGISLEQWLRYTSTDVLKYYMYQKPRTCKRLYFDVIPQQTDNYINDLYHKAPIIKYINSSPPNIQANISYSMLLNLANVCNAENEQIMMEFVERYSKIEKEERQFWLELVKGVVNYYHDYIKPNKFYRIPSENEYNLLKELSSALKVTNNIKDTVYEIGKKYGNLQEWFKMVYQVLLGQDSGPRLYSFIEIYTIEKFCQLISEKIDS